jgi:4-hydroxybenzoate polyprenyltransferase
MFFVRVAHWWYSKIPPPAMLLMMLLAGNAPAVDLWLSLGELVVVISLVCNFGYVLNELFDVEEDAKGSRVNVASVKGASWLWLVAVICVAGSLTVALLTMGAIAAVLTLSALLFPLAYSAPPLRLKERRWLGVFADGLAAHLYPALLCLLIASRWHAIGAMLVLPVLLWSLMLGLRGILTHQVLDEDRDRASGLRTVVQHHGRDAIIGWIRHVISPLEIACLVATVVQTNAGAIFYVIVGVYIFCEVLKVRVGWTITLFSETTGPYVPFLNNAFYEVWGPISIALDVAAHDARLLVLPVVLVAAFWSRILVEWKMTAALGRDISRHVRFPFV